MMDNQWGQFSTYGNGLPATGSAGNGGAPQNYYNLDAEYSVSTIDVPHRIVLAPVVRIPGPANGVASWFLGGWSASAIVEFVSGPPISAYVTNLSAANLGLFNGLQRPNLTGQPVSTTGDDLDRIATADHPTAAWISAAGYANPGLGRTAMRRGRTATTVTSSARTPTPSSRRGSRLPDRRAARSGSRS